MCLNELLVGTSKRKTNNFFIGEAWFPKRWGKVVRWSPKVSPIGLPFQRRLERWVRPRLVIRPRIVIRPPVVIRPPIGSLRHLYKCNFCRSFEKPHSIYTYTDMYTLTELVVDYRVRSGGIREKDNRLEIFVSTNKREVGPLA